MEKVDIYLEVARFMNTDVFGWGVVILGKKTHRKMSDGDSGTIRNRMCLIAAITALEALEVSCKVRLYTDSKYLCNGIVTWIKNWENRGWKTSKNKPVENEDLWKRLKEVAGRHQIEWVWTPRETASVGYERKEAIAIAHKAMVWCIPLLQ